MLAGAALCPAVLRSLLQRAALEQPIAVLSRLQAPAALPTPTPTQPLTLDAPWHGILVFEQPPALQHALRALQVTTPDDMSVAERFLEEAAAAARAAGLSGAPPPPSCACTAALGAPFGPGWLAQHVGFYAVFLFCVVLMAVWLALSLSMTAPLAIKTRMFRVGTMPADQAALLKTKLAAVAGVVEAVVLAEEGVAMLKVSLQGWDEAAARILLEATGA